MQAEGKKQKEKKKEEDRKKKRKQSKQVVPVFRARAGGSQVQDQPEIHTVILTQRKQKKGQQKDKK